MAALAASTGDALLDARLARIAVPVAALADAATRAAEADADTAGAAGGKRPAPVAATGA
ncbi:MAG TPA: hypothetical protein VHE35_26730 [Kofleriaceae bacterium]|nr:hypothetical protein [Kofleriaceae bacterium]